MRAAPASLELLNHAQTVKSFNARVKPVVTKLDVPSKLRALPAMPAVHAGLLSSVPVLPSGEASAVCVPVPSLNCHQPTRFPPAANIFQAVPLQNSICLLIAL